MPIYFHTWLCYRNLYVDMLLSEWILIINLLLRSFDRCYHIFDISISILFYLKIFNINVSGTSMLHLTAPGMAEDIEGATHSNSPWQFKMPVSAWELASFEVVQKFASKWEQENRFWRPDSTSMLQILQCNKGRGNQLSTHILICKMHMCDNRQFNYESFPFFLSFLPKVTHHGNTIMRGDPIGVS